MTSCDRRRRRAKAPAWLVLFFLATVSHPKISLADDPASGDSEAELAKKLQNPVANLISVPFQNNWDFGIGPAHAMKYTVNIQPVVPISLTQDWNLIVRTITPVIYAEAPVDGGDSSYGLGDILQSFFLSPSQQVGGWILGAGPAFLYPSATDNALGGQKWGAGPTVVLLQQKSGWTYGVLANKIWSFAGSSHRSSVNSAFLQPFLSYTTATHTTFGVNTESTYDFVADQWTIPINGFVSQLVKLGKLPVQFSVGPRYYADAPSGGPDWGMRFVVTLLFPT